MSALISHKSCENDYLSCGVNFKMIIRMFGPSFLTQHNVQSKNEKKLKKKKKKSKQQQQKKKKKKHEILRYFVSGKQWDERMTSTEQVTEY